jgi:hypothetical protein
MHAFLERYHVANVDVAQQQRQLWFAARSRLGR